MGMWMIAVAVAWICPECATFLASIDELGRCPACRRPAVRLEAERVTFYRCASHRAWHAAPCARQESEQCCTPVRCPAMREPSSSWTPWCPECRRFHPPVGDDGACRGCGWPPVIAASRLRSWFWCSTGERWRDDRCADDELRRCCSERSGLYLTEVRP